MPVAATEVDKYLETLGLTSEDLNEDAVRVAYKKLALRWHPDRHNADPEEAKQKFIEVNEAYKALVEVCKKRNKRGIFRRNSSLRSAFWASSAPSASSSSTQTTRGTESTAKEDDSHNKEKHEASRAHPDIKSGRSRSRGADAAPRTARAHSKSPHRHHRDTDSDASSEAGCASDLVPSAHAHAHDHIKPGAAKAKKPTLGEDDYEFIDLGTPLKPLRSPRSFSATTKDWIFPLHLSLEDLYFGAVHRYRITRTLNPAAPHTKSSPVSSADAGSRRQTVQIDVRVSPGWTTGTRIRVPRVGNQRADGSFQDIVFVVAEAPHPRFIRRGNDLILPVRVPWIDPHPRPYPPGALGGDTYHGLGHDDGAGSGRYRLGRGAFRQVRSGLEPAHGHPPEEADEVYVLGINGEEYTIPIPRTLVEAADGTRIYGAGMPVRKNGCIVGMGDMVIRWEFVFPESDKLQRSRWQTLKDAIHLRLPV
ncbi:DnaJ-domain-containing protein [Trametes cingulata]|nr:DnaJ-domain-containing protein [Trametes cingulata]